jgi:hypothetical protein
MPYRYAIATVYGTMVASQCATHGTIGTMYNDTCTYYHRWYHHWYHICVDIMVHVDGMALT